MYIVYSKMKICFLTKLKNHYASFPVSPHTFSYISIILWHFVRIKSFKIIADILLYYYCKIVTNQAKIQYPSKIGPMIFVHILQNENKRMLNTFVIHFLLLCLTESGFFAKPCLFFLPFLFRKL